MAIQYPGGTTVFTYLDASSKASLLAAIEAAWTAAGWELETTKAYVILTFSGNPSNNQTVTLAGRAYRFVTTLSQAYDVKIGGTGSATAQNLCYAINDTEDYEGTLYGSGTAAHADLEAVMVDANKVRVQWKSSGYGNGFSVSINASNVSTDSTTGRYGGPKLTSYPSPAGRMKLWCHDANNVYLDVVTMTEDETVRQARPSRLAVATGRQLLAVVNRYQYFVAMPNNASTSDSAMNGGVPYIRAGHVAPTVESVTEQDGQFVVHTSAPHGLATGQWVHVAGSNLSGMNGSWQVSVIDADSYVLLGSSYQSGYEPNTARAAGPTQISRAMWHVGDSNSFAKTFRGSLTPLTSYSAGLTVVNSHLHGTTDINASEVRLGILCRAGYSAVSRNWGNLADVLEPRIGWITEPGGTFVWVGQLWGAFLVTAPADMDVQKVGFDGHDWIQWVNNDSNGSLWLATN